MILPGSKSVRADLAWLRAQHWIPYLERHLRYGGRLLGICGGLQMLGRRIHDPLGIEGEPGSTDGLGWLDLETTLAPDKQLRNVEGRLQLDGGVAVRGYEIHAGVSTGPALDAPLIDLGARSDGSIGADGQVLATYLHGLFDTSAACTALLRWAGLAAPQALDLAAQREASIERLADAVEQHLDLRSIFQLLGLP